MTAETDDSVEIKAVQHLEQVKLPEGLSKSNEAYSRLRRTVVRSQQQPLVRSPIQPVALAPVFDAHCGVEHVLSNAQSVHVRRGWGPEGRPRDPAYSLSHSAGPPPLECGQ